MRLNLNPGIQPYRLFDGQEIIVHCRPALTEVIEAAKADAELLEMFKDLRDDASLSENMKAVKNGGEITPELLRTQGSFGVLFVKAIAREVIESWEGIEDPDGSPAPVTPDRINSLLDLSPVHDAFVLKYLNKWLLLQTEKNDSAPSPIGISGVAPNTAEPALASVTNARKGLTSR